MIAACGRRLKVHHLLAPAGLRWESGGVLSFSTLLSSLLQHTAEKPTLPPAGVEFCSVICCWAANMHATGQAFVLGMTGLSVCSPNCKGRALGVLGRGCRGERMLRAVASHGWLVRALGQVVGSGRVGLGGVNHPLQWPLQS